jgi:3'(2'), 5'-bisphosphate nucleotidase
MNSLIPELCGQAQEAGRRILRFYGNGVRVVAKADSSPLTEADQASHEFLMASLKELGNGWPVVSEEAASAAPTVVNSNERFWLVDPLDGTKEFLKGSGEFTVNIALIKRGRPILGVVHAPALGLTYYAAREGGAWRQVDGQQPSRISVRHAEPSRLVVVASKDHAGPLVETMLARLPGASRQSMGSSLKFCLVAEGKADLYLRDLPTMEWDTAAAQCIVEAASGAVCSLDGKPLRYAKPGLKNPPIMTMGDPSLEWKRYIQEMEDKREEIAVQRGTGFATNCTDSSERRAGV